MLPQQFFIRRAVLPLQEFPISAALAHSVLSCPLNQDGCYGQLRVSIFIVAGRRIFRQHNAKRLHLARALVHLPPKILFLVPWTHLSLTNGRALRHRTIRGSYDYTCAPAQRNQLRKVKQEDGTGLTE